MQADTARTIRPILLVQVERTGKEQRETGFIHAEDAREYLLRLGFHQDEIAVKTSEVNDLKTPENIDLHSPTCPVRVIITKSALQEGWDCPFAYILCSLSGSQNMSALTQLVGRILRQPDTAKTGVALLDECYVVCLHAKTKDVIDGIKKGLENDGMADLAMQIRESGGDDDSGNEDGDGDNSRKLGRRQPFHKTEIYLPIVLRVKGETVRQLDYEQDILLGLDWNAANLDALAEKIPLDAHATETQTTRIGIADGTQGEYFPTDMPQTRQDKLAFDPVYATRVITDIVPNPWVARSLVGGLLDRLRARGFDDDRLGALSGFILEELRKHLFAERDRLAESQFMTDVAAGKIQFRLRTDRNNWRLPHSMTTDQTKNAPQMVRDDGRHTEKSLFAPVYQADFNQAEREFACYIDEAKALQWWHRNVAKPGHYFLQGWRKNKVYPDFIFALDSNSDKRRLVVLETKGDQLEGNLDTAYKRKLMERLSESYRFDAAIKAGELNLVGEETEIVCDLVLMSEWKSVFHNRYLAED